MNAPRDLDSIVTAWLEEGPTRLPDQTRRSIAVALPMTSQQRRAMRVPWRFPTMSTMPKLAVGAMVVIAVLLGGAFLLRPGPSGNEVGGAPILSPSPSASPAPSASAARLPFTSTRYGYSLSTPAGWRTIPATRAWTLAVDRGDWMSPGADQYRQAGDALLFTAFAAPIPTGTTSDDWIAAYIKPDTKSSPGPCRSTPVDLGAISVDGHPATFRTEPDAKDCGGTWAFVPVGNRMFVFTIWLPGYETPLKEFLSTVRFQN